MINTYLAIVLFPLAAAIIAGLFGRLIGRAGAHTVTILGVGVACVLSCWVLWRQVVDGYPAENISVYTWLVTDGVRMEIGFLVDRLSALMMVVVSFVSLMVHIYTIGYMHDDAGYQRFFSYISLFTFAMLMLVMSNNLLQLFFGWEAVGVVSYLLIGFWYTRPTAIFANLKAFLVNRVGDFGFLLGIAALLYLTNSLDYAEIFAAAEGLQDRRMLVGSWEWPALATACILLFIGAMGKSAQVPLHVWLPDSMEGPTPISALIHAATMVTAGVFMVARMSPLFEFAEAALSFVLIIGATTALFTGLIALVQFDIKRVVAYSTLSQLGYMMVAQGSSAYAAGMFHLTTHAFFKALLFLAAGSVIMALHHEQDMRRMGGLRRHLPVTYWTSLIGCLALIGFPGFAGFFSKDALIEAEHLATIPGAGYAYACILLGVFVTSLYTFRMFFMVFHGEERLDVEARAHLHEPGWVVKLPLILLAIPSLALGWLAIGPVVFGDFFGGSLFVRPVHDVVGRLGADWRGPFQFVLHGFKEPAVYLALAGVFVAWFGYLYRPAAAAWVRERTGPVQRLLENKYYADWVAERLLPAGSRALGNVLWRVGDVRLIDGTLVNGSARLVAWGSGMIRRLQSGLLYDYAFAMVIGLAVLGFWLLFTPTGAG
ncbi:MAG: NADH-quinone oxidoreductase subunit L [Gammaproteobacteria bacterium]